jgi:FemAB-related protein (PEP-CTERM system-associated)
MVKLVVQLPQASPSLDLTVRVHGPEQIADCLPRLAANLEAKGQGIWSYHPTWLVVLREGLGQRPYCLEAVADGQTRGFLLLSHLRSLLFGRFLVSLPFINYGGPVADNETVAALLVDRAVALADELKVRYLELRQEEPTRHPALNERRCDKVHMRLALPATAAELWDQLTPKVRNQVRKGQKNGLTVAWGGQELLKEFYGVFARNMRDLGTPVFPRRLFGSVLEHFAGRAELCLVRGERKALAGALLLHGRGVTEVPNASSLRAYNHTCANMLMYWHLLERAVQRQQAAFDFGRSSVDSPTYRFKKQWGAVPTPAEWQFYIRTGSAGTMRKDNPRYQRLIACWKRLPVAVTRLLGPFVVRGIP